VEYISQRRRVQKEIGVWKLAKGDAIVINYNESTGILHRRFGTMSN